MDDTTIPPAEGAGKETHTVSYTVDTSLAQLRDPDPQVRQDAIRKLGEMGDARALSALESTAAHDPR
jgi:HEAT repeat protein